MSSLGRELSPAIAIGRPRFRYYPGPPTGAILFLPFAALAAFGFLTFRAALSPGFYWFIAGCAGLMLLIAAVTTAIWLRFGVTISLRELGVAITVRGRKHEIRYADIDAVTIHDKRRYDDNVVVRAMTRTIAIEAAGRTVKAQYVALPQDGLDATLDALVERIAAEARPRSGKGWRIEHGTLETRKQSVPLSAIAAAGVFERNVRLWKHHDEEHFFAVPYDSRNARVLLALAQRTHVDTQRDPAPSTNGIGRLLFARRTTLASIVGNTILAAFVIGLAWLSMDRLLHLGALARVAALGASVLWIVFAIHRAAVRYRFHERGVVRITLFGSRTLAYEHVSAMAWRETSTSLEHAIPMGTSVHAKLVPDDGSRPFSITLHRLRGQDGDLEPIRTRIAQHIAEHLRMHLERGDEVPWTSKAKFTREGIALKRALLRYDEPIRVFFRDGYLVFYRDSWRKPLALLPASDVNFYPGLVLFEMLMPRELMEAEQTA